MRRLLTIASFLISTAIFGQTSLTPAQADSLIAAYENDGRLYNSSSCGWDTTVDPSVATGWSYGFSCDTATHQYLQLYKEATDFYRDYWTFYYFRGALLLMKVKRFAREGDKELFEGKYYYAGGKMVRKSETARAFGRPEQHLKWVPEIISMQWDERHLRAASVQHGLLRAGERPKAKR